MGTRKGYRVTVTDRTNNRRVAAFNITGMNLGKKTQNSVTKRKKSIRRKPSRKKTITPRAKRKTTKRTASSKPQTERTEMVTNFGMRVG